jgi:predicted MFS family arabinose efflux permease
MSSAPSPATARPRVAAPMAGIIIAMALIEALSGITQGYLNPILPALGPELKIDDPTINGLFLISSVAFAVMTPIISRLGDSLGCRMILRVTAVVVAVGVFLMALWPTLITVTIGVVLLTCVVGFIPLMMGILRATNAAATRSGVSVMIATLMITVGVGGLLAGIVGAQRPTLGFWVAVPFAVIALVASFVLPKGLEGTREPLAALPLALCTLGLIGFVIALSMGGDWGWTSPLTLVSGIGGLILLALWWRLDRRVDATRFIDLRMLSIPRVRIVTVATFLFGFASISYMGTNGIFLHSEAAATAYGFGMNPLDIAVVLAACSVLAFASSLALPVYMRRVGERAALFTAAGLLALGFALMAVLHGTVVGYIAGLSVFYLGIGAYQAATRTLSVEGIPVDETATAAGLNELALSVGIALGAAAAKLLSTAFVTPDGHIALSGIVGIWITLFAAAALAGIVALKYPRTPAHQEASA